MMKICSLAIFACFVFTQAASAQPNTAIKYSLNPDATVMLSSAAFGSFLLRPDFIVLKRKSNPNIHYENQSQNLKKFKDAVTVPCWTSAADTITPDYFQTAAPVHLLAVTSSVKNNVIYWTFPKNGQFELKANLDLNAANPKINFTVISNDEAYYSVGFAGMPQADHKSVEGIFQPWIWQQKRFPETSYLSTEDMCPLPAILMTQKNITSGLVPDPAYLPFRMPALRKGNIKFGVTIRNEKGNAQPLLFAPVLGNPDSYLRTGSAYSFAVNIIINKGNISQTHQAIAEKIFKFKDYRQNVFISLNGTLENMLEYAMNDRFSGWNEELKGFDYTLDVAQTVKVVSGLHALSVAKITDDENIYWNRALPMTEFNLSRERFLFSVYNNINEQNASSRLTGPGIEVAELTALDSYYKKQTPIFKYYADSLKKKVRTLNLGVKSDGSSWANMAGLYKETKDPEYLKNTVQLATEYIKKRVDTDQTDFRSAGGDQQGRLSTGNASHFWTDYTPMWMELLDLYELTGDKKYLEASLKGARQYAQYVWFSPRIPDSTIVTSYLKAPVPAWRVSQIGLTPEAANTFHDNPGIFLAHFAAHFLRLSYYADDKFLRSIARSAIIGRYANFPGYTIGSYDAMYSRPDYPYNSNLHGLFYYNHVWPQIALLFDYLISDAFVQSDAKIVFPNEFVPAYAYLKSKVYGSAPGRFYTDTNVNLWMPRQLLNISNEQINYISGYGNGNFYVALLNQSNRPVNAVIKINTDLTSLNIHKNYNVRVWKNNQVGTPQKIEHGELNISIPAKGITAFVVDSLSIHTQFQQKTFNGAALKIPQKSFKVFNTPMGKLSSTIISFGDNLRSFYLWSEALPDACKEAILEYRYSAADNWTKLTDNRYPYEYNLRLKADIGAVEYRVHFYNGEGKETYVSPVEQLQVK